MRTDSGGWRHLLGRDLAALRDVGFASPKLRTAAPPGFGEGFTQANAIRTRGFRAVGALALGGLSNIWGALACAYDGADMAGWPIGVADLDPSFRRVAARIGLSGSADDDLGEFQGAGLPLQPPLLASGVCADLLDRYGRRSAEIGGLRLGHARNAVLSQGLDGRHACDLGKACMWGCATGAVYNAADEIERMLRHPNVALAAGVLVERLEVCPSGWRVRGRRPDGSEEVLTAPKVILAAGTLASTRLGLAALGRVGEERRLFSAPAFAFALLSPRFLGRNPDEVGFGMAQLVFNQPLSPFPGDGLFGSLYDADAFALSDMVAGLPLTKRGAMTLMGALLPALAVGLGYFPGAYSANRVRLGGDGMLEVDGGVVPDLAAALRRAGRSLARGFRALGGWLVPGSLKPFPPGTEVHYAGPLAMGDLSTRDGELVGAPGLYVADGAALPSVSAKHHTFTVMANADRIATRLAE